MGSTLFNIAYAIAAMLVTLGILVTIHDTATSVSRAGAV
jgi:hypothetical protein